MASRIDVFCRVRPTDKLCAEQIHFPPGNTQIQISRNSRRSAMGSSEQQILHSYNFDKVFTGSQATQENVYRATSLKLVNRGLLDGISGTLLCYGQRDSGKSYTIFGGSDFRARGIAARAVSDVFAGIRRYASERVYTVSVTFLHIHGERVTDLLAGPQERTRPNGGGRGGAKDSRGDARPTIALDGKGTVVLKSIERRQCPTEEEALAAVFEGLHTRPQGTNAHLAFTIYARHQSLIDSESETREACLHIVDLAGTQRVEGLSSEEQAEVQSVNRSLSMLEQVVLCLGSPQTNSNGEAVQGHIPYRQSKLTTLLKDCIGGTSLTSLIAHIYPEQQFVDNTISTLNFAKRMMHVTTDPTVNVVQDAGTQIRSLQRQLVDLKSELRMQNQLSSARVAQAASAGAAAGKVTALGTDELQVIHEKVRGFIDGSSSLIHVNDVREMNACFSFFRTLMEQKDVTISELQNEMNAAKAQSSMQHRQSGARESETSAAASNEVSTTAPATGKGGRSGTWRSANKQSQQQTTVKEDLHTPNVLDRNTGVSYGVAGKASSSLAAIERLEKREQEQPLYPESTPPPPPLPSQRSAHVVPPGAGQMPPISKQQQQQQPPYGGMYSNNKAAVNNSPPPAALQGSFNDGMPARTATSGRNMMAATAPAQARQGYFSPHHNHTVPPLSAPSPKKHNGQNYASPTRNSKSHAFEDYKRTESGALQVRALSDDRDQLLKMDKKRDRLQQRLNESEDVVADRSANDGRPNSGSGRRGWRESAVDDDDDPRMMSPLHLTAYHHTLEESMRALMMQRSHLVKQMERRRMALMTNFNEWFTRVSGEASERPNSNYNATDPTTDRSRGRFHARVEDSGTVESEAAMNEMMHLEEDRFLDAAERFDAMELHRHTAQDPKSGAFYAAKKLVESKTRDRASNRGGL